MRKYELTTLASLPSNCWLVNRHERDRFYRILAKWQKENPKATTIQEMLCEDLIRLHIMEQRLHDCRVFFDGSRTSMLRISPHDSAMPQEDISQKQAEFNKYWPMVHSAKRELYKLALANDVSINLTGNVRSITEFFKAHDDISGKETTDKPETE